jgi:hypothetical protein
MKRPSNEVTINLLALAAVAALGIWLMVATEWADVWKPTPPRGEAARDDHYAVKQIVAKLGGKVTSSENLDRLPPAGATLVLQSNEWDFLPGRNQQLRQWVEEQGGHLVLPSFYATGNDIPWIPIREKKQPTKESANHGIDGDDEDEDDSKPAAAPPAKPTTRDDDSANPKLVGPRNRPHLQCPSLTETSADASAPPRLFRLCGGEWASRLEPMPWAQSSWSINGPRGAHSLRIPLGKGRVTAIAEHRYLSNRSLFLGDHAQAAIAALDLRPGNEVWFVMDEKREALLKWLWHRAGPAIGLALLAMAFALWRGAQRFGPLLPQTPLARRSMAEQIRGTAAFVLRGGGAPLLAAARRALDEAARQRIAGYDRMTMGQRIEALRQPTGLSGDVLIRALDPQLPPGRGRALADKLTVIEQTRRRLAFNS